MKHGYDRDAAIGYAPGVFPSLELLCIRPKQVKGLLVHPDGMRNEGVLRLIAQCNDLGIRPEEAPRALARIAGKDNCYAAAVFDKYEDVLQPQSSHLLLHNPSDMGNLGTILRTAAGFGIGDIALVRPAADIFDPRVVRASMGAVFRARIRYFDSMQAYDEAYPGRACYFFRLENAAPASELAPLATSPLTLVFGNESSGLPAELSRREHGVIIPHSDAIDSLNLAVAVGIGLNLFFGRYFQ